MNPASRGMIRSGLLVILAATVGCGRKPPGEARGWPKVSPDSQPAGETPRIDTSSPIPAMTTELLAVDLPTVVRLAQARNLDIQLARQRVETLRGQHESRRGELFPVLAPTAVFEHFIGSNRTVQGSIVEADFWSFQPAAAIQWVINPGRVIYDMAAARKRLEASEQQEQAAVMETLRSTAAQYYDLTLAQAHVATAQKARAEAEEQVRTAALQSRAGTSLPNDELKAQAALGNRDQELALALNQFYRASVSLAGTLHMDPVVTLVPSQGELVPRALVAENLSVNDLLSMAVQYRPDLQSVRTLIGAAAADAKSARWGGLGPQVQASVQEGGIQGANGDAGYGIHEQQRVVAAASWNLGLSTLGQIKAADAREREAATQAERKMDEVKAQVVRAFQDSATYQKLLPIAKVRLASSVEALRVSQDHLKVGAMTPLNVLQAQSAEAEARFRYAEVVARYNQAQVNLLAGLGLVNAKNLLATLNGGPP